MLLSGSMAKVSLSGFFDLQLAMVPEEKSTCILALHHLISNECRNKTLLYIFDPSAEPLHSDPNLYTLL